MENYPYPMQNIFVPNPFSCIISPPLQQGNGSPFFSVPEPLSFLPKRGPLLQHPPPSRNSQTDSSPDGTVKMSLCEVNLDDVPMELVTSEEDSGSEYANAFLSAYTESVDNSVVQNCSVELDEIELRSRALRSMLLQKKTTPVDETQQKTELPPLQNSPEVKTVCQKIMSCDLSTLKQKQKFVITVHDSSDSDDSLSLPIGAVFKGPTANKCTSKPHTFTNASERSKKISRFHQEEKMLLQRKMELLKLKLTVKRQQHLIDERRKIVRKLSTTLSELRKRTKHTTVLYKEANNSLLKAQRMNATYQRKLASAQKSYSDVLNSVNRSTADVLQTGFALSSVNLRRDLVILSLDILQKAKVVTWFTAHYQFGSTTSKFNIKSVKPPTTVATSAETSQEFDPFRPICPFFLDGECLDKTCIFQHLKCSTVAKAKPKGYLPSSVVSMDSVLLFSQSKKGKYNDLYCELCKENLITCGSDSSQPIVIQRWHSAYLAYLRSDSKNSSLLVKFVNDLDGSAYPADLCAHLVFGLLLCSNLDATTIKQKLFDSLKAFNFPLDACRLALRHPSLSIPTRRSLTQSSLEYIALQLQNDKQANQESGFESPFAYFVYHWCLLEQEAGLSNKVTTVLTNILETLPKENKLIYVLWWLRLYHQLNGVLPQENLFPTANALCFSKSVLLANQEVIEMAVTETGVSTNLSQLLGSFQNISTDISSTCFLYITHLYIQNLNANSKFKAAADIALTVALHSPNFIDDLFFPSAVYSLFRLDSSLDWTTFISNVPDNLRVNLNLAHRIEFGFLITCLNWHKKEFNSMEFHLIECLGNLIFLPKDDFQSVISAYEDLLNIKPSNTSLINFKTCPRSSTYLWLSYCLYNIIHCLNYREVLDHLVNHYKSCIMSCEHEDANHAFIRLLALMCIFLASRVNQLDNSSYSTIIKLLFIDNPFKLDRKLLPLYFLELVQHINLRLLPPGIRHDICVQLVEIYGASLVPSLCRTLCALGDYFVAQSLCAIGCLDKPDNEDFWLLYASTTFKTLSHAQSPEQLSTLLEILTSATSMVTSSSRLWKYYALAVRIAKVSVEQVTNRAKCAGMYDLISSSLNNDNPTKFLSELGLLCDERSSDRKNSS
ncbi:hypothetical protein MN116_003304 [Schistosoma mekongi]|uniref:C3H1-type domain-containing protein n=1 Tax=Schistosoma mekongi TaxID=38744 RepID=A0AAE1ZHA6_SCHME|nr:hypothetical protein MN116_003304 [Schistosoma mekongi]